jgi:uncharacterized Zn finger protein
MHENYFAKARRLLGEGRVTVQRVGPRSVDALVRGDSAESYPVTYRPGAWSYPCPALGRCSHVQAVMLVVMVAAGGAQ